jgi:hypothetical protein
MPRGATMWIHSDASALRAGDYTLTFAPETVFNFASAGELRACAEEIIAVLQRYGIFAKGREYIGKTVGIAGEHLTGGQMADALTRGLGQEVRYNDVPPDVYRSSGVPGAEEIGNMYQFNRDFAHVLCGARNVDLARALNPSLQTFDQWLTLNKSRIPLD